MPFAKYKDFKACVAANQDKSSPEGYCAAIHYKATGKWPTEKEGLDRWICPKCGRQDNDVEDKVCQGCGHKPIWKQSEGIKMNYKNKLREMLGKKPLSEHSEKLKKMKESFKEGLAVMTKDDRQITIGSGKVDEYKKKGWKLEYEEAMTTTPNGKFKVGDKVKGATPDNNIVKVGKIVGITPDFVKVSAEGKIWSFDED